MLVDLDRGATIAYDDCVLATGSLPVRAARAGTDAAGVFVYRTLDDLDAMRSWATPAAAPAAVVGGGLLGLEAANALRQLGLETTVVELAPRLMAVQLDDGGGAPCAATSRGSGSRFAPAPPQARCSRRLTAGPGARPRRGRGAGRRPRRVRRRHPPRDQLAREAGLEIGERGGVVVDDACAHVGPRPLRHR